MKLFDRKKNLFIGYFSQSSDRLGNNFPSEAFNNRSQQQHTAYILQPPSALNLSSAGNTSRNRVRDRKNQTSLRHGQKSSSTINSIGDEQSQPSTASTAMRSLDRKQARPLPQNSTTSKTQMKTSHTDIYGSLERNKHSKVSQPTLHATILNDENDRMNKADNQAHDFYHLTSTHPPSANTTTSTIVNVGNALQQQQQQQHGSFDHTDSTPPPLPPTSSTTRSRRPPPAVFQPHYDSSTTTPKDNYYTISGSKDVSPHPHSHAHIRGLVADNFYGGPYANKPPMVPPSQQQSMQRYDTSPLLVRRLENVYPSQSRHQPSSYNRTQSSVMMTTSQPPPTTTTSGRFMANHSSQSSSGLLYRPHSSQSSSSQSSG